MNAPLVRVIRGVRWTRMKEDFALILGRQQMKGTNRTRIMSLQKIKGNECVIRYVNSGDDKSETESFTYRSESRL